jgi:antitoxin YefM
MEFFFALSRFSGNSEALRFDLPLIFQHRDGARPGSRGTLTRARHGQYTVQIMKSITYTAARENLASTINRVCEDQAPVVITRNRDQAVVMLSLAEYESLEETAHLLRSPENAKRLLRSIDQLERKKGVRKTLKLTT